MENISKELNYSPVVNNHSSIVYRTVSPQAGGDITLNSASSSGQSEFIIPPSCWIPELTRLSFDISIAADAAQSNKVNANLLTCIDRITVYDTATSNLLLDCSNFHKYASLVTPGATKIEDFLTKPAKATGIAVPVNSTAAFPIPFEDISRNLDTANIGSLATATGGTPAGSDMQLFSNTGRKQFYIGAATAATYLSVNIPFSALKMTALSSDKIWYSPSSLVIQIYWAATDNFAFMSTAATAVATTATSCGVTIIKSPKLYLANEGNLAIVSQVINKVMTGGGIQLPIAYPTVVQSTTSASAAATNISFQYQLTRGYGNTILALITAPFSNTAGVNEKNYHPRYVTNNYNTFLNNVAIKYPSGFVGLSTTLAATDYALGNEMYLNGSVVQNISEYINGEWVHIDGFFGNKKLSDVNQHELDGLDVTTQSSTWQWVADVTGVATGYRVFTVIVGQKTLQLSAQGTIVR
jgi:hypothetical protein